MEITYMMAGKRFQAQDLDDVNNQLQAYKLVTTSDDICDGVRKVSEQDRKYVITQSHGDSADFSGYDIVIGTEIADNGYEQPDVQAVDLLNLETKLNEVREDIPDAKIIFGSYWS